MTVVRFSLAMLLIAASAAGAATLRQSVKLSAVIDGRYGELVAGMSGKVLMAPSK